MWGDGVSFALPMLGGIAGQLLLAFLGLASGLSVASGVFTVFTAVGLVPRFAEHTGSGDHIMKYENAIILGCFAGNVFSLFRGFFGELSLFTASNFFSEAAVSGAVLRWIGIVLLAVTGLFVGIYVGTLAVSIAEMLDAIPIMTHRIGLKRGVSFVIGGLAVGKLVGSLFYYLNGVYGW